MQFNSTRFTAGCNLTEFSRFYEKLPGLEINRSPPVVTDVPPKPHRWTTAVASADFAVATGGPPVEVLTVPPVAHRRFHKSANFAEIIGFKSISEYNSYHYIWIH